MKELKREIEDLIYNNAPDFEIAKVIKKDIENYYKTLPNIFAQSGGKDFLLKHTKKIDSIIKLIYRIATREMFLEYTPTKNALPLTILALGSYGREQLSPKSDIDIAFIYKEIPGYNIKEVIEKMLYIMWDAKLKLGHRVHEISEIVDVANSDITIKTALLESRFLEGSKFLNVEIGNQIEIMRKIDQKEFILEKIQERREMRKKFPLMMEPNLKEGVGGFRDANLAFWIGKLLYNVPRIKDLPSSIVNENDYREFRVALEFLFRVRSALHLSVKKKSDQLRLDNIPDVAKLLQYKSTPNKHLLFAKKVNKSLRVIWLYSRIWIDAQASSLVPIYKNYLKSNKSFKDSSELLKFLIKSANNPFNSHPTLNLQVIHTAKSSDTKLHYALIKRVFEAKYTSSILIALSEAGKLGTYITPIKKVEALPQFDGYHKYPVDTHLIKCVEALENIKDKRLLNIYNKLPKNKKLVLKLATFLHDCGKGRPSDHHKIGADLFKIYAKALELDSANIELGYRLILHHNQLSQIAQKEDIYNQKSISKMAALFPSKIELDMIYLLTYADTTGVGSDIYNSFTARLFETLYLNAVEFLQHKVYIDEMSKRVTRVNSIKRSKSFKMLPKNIQKKVLEIESNLPFIKYRTSRIIEIAKRAITIDTYETEITNNKFLTIEIIKKIKLDLGYLLARLSMLNIVNIDIIKLFDGKKYFKIDFNQKVTDDDIEDIKVIVKEAFLNPTEVKITIPKIEEKNIEIDCNHSSDYAQITIKAQDQQGLLAYIMTIFEKNGIDIVSSKIYTHKSNVSDTFLIEKNGNFCKNIDTIKEKLTKK